MIEQLGQFSNCSIEAFIVNTDRKGYLVADPEVIIDNAPTVEERQQDEDLCESCIYGDICVNSDKGVSFAKHSKCWKYGKVGGRQ